MIRREVEPMRHPDDPNFIRALAPVRRPPSKRSRRERLLALTRRYQRRLKGKKMRNQS